MGLIVGKHGGNIYQVAREFNLPERRIVDFSASINPLGVSKIVASAIRNNIRALPNYPDPDSTRFTAQLARHLHISPDSIVCGNGSTELIYLAAQALKPHRTLIPAPTFCEYERAVQTAAGGTVKHFNLEGRHNFDINIDDFIQAIQGCQMAFLCNPNNPTGRILRRADLLKIAQAAAEFKCYLVLDEAFIDFLPEESLVSEVEKYPYLIILRSMTKFYALSGLRLGYGIFPPSLAQTIKAYQQPWTVNTLALAAGTAALNDAAYTKKTLKVLGAEKRFMEHNFRRLGIGYIPSCANYYLIKLDRAQFVIAALRAKGILLRDCSGFAGLDGSYVRVAVKSRRHNSLLFRELARLCRA